MTKLKKLPFQMTLDTDPDRLALRAWLKENKNHFIEGDWTIREVALFALSWGFHAITIAQVFSHWSDALAGTNFDNRAAFRSFSLDIALEDFHKLQDKLDYVPELDLRPQWKAVHQFLFEGITFDDAA